MWISRQALQERYGHFCSQELSKETCMAKLPPMAEGGQWIQKPDGSPPIYVTHKEHIKRLVLDGAQVVADPRPALAAQQHEQEVSATEDLKAQIAHLQAQLEAK